MKEHILEKKKRKGLISNKMIYCADPERGIAKFNELNGGEPVMEEKTLKEEDEEIYPRTHKFYGSEYEGENASNLQVLDDSEYSDLESNLGALNLQLSEVPEVEDSKFVIKDSEDTDGAYCITLTLSKNDFNNLPDEIKTEVKAIIRKCDSILKEYFKI